MSNISDTDIDRQTNILLCHKQRSSIMTSSAEEPPKDDMELPMVVTNETMEEDRTAVGAVKEETVNETSHDACDGGVNKLEPRTPRARGGGERCVLVLHLLAIRLV